MYMVLTLSIIIWHQSSYQLEPMAVGLVGGVNVYNCLGKLLIQLLLGLRLIG